MSYSSGCEMDTNPDAADTSRPARQRFLFINKTADSTSLSHSDGLERLRLLSAAQRTSRKSVRGDGVRAVQRQTAQQGRFSVGSSRNKSRQQEKESQPTGTAQFQVMPATPPSAIVNRIQMTAHFFESYYPADMPGQDRVVNKLRLWMEPKNGAVATAAADSMIVLHAAQTMGDEILRKEGMLRYHKALQLLRHALQSPESAQDDGVLGAVEIMGVVETRLLDTLAGDFEGTQRAHLSGLYALLLARGPSVLRSCVGRNVLLQHLHELLMVSLLSRKSCVFGNSDWQTAFQRAGSKDKGMMYQLTALGCRIPEAFEKADTLINDSTSTNVQYTNLLTELVALEELFSNWLRDRHARHSDDRPYSLITASLSSSFYDQSTVLQECYPFPSVVQHHSFMDALAHLNYWGLVLMLLKTILDVLTALESADSFASSERSSHSVRAQCSEIADLFCQSACYIYRLPEHHSMIAKQGIVAFLIAIVLPWYSFAEDEEKMKWCSILIQTFQQQHTDLDMVETTQQTWTTKLYIGWINMAF